MTDTQLTLSLETPAALVTHFDRALYHLAAATRIDETMTIRDQAEQMKLLGRQAQDKTLQADAVELSMRAERKLGELLAQAREAGQIGTGRMKKNGSGEEPFARIRLEDAGITKKLSHKAQALAKRPEAIFEDVVRQSREKILAGKPVTINAMRDVAKREKQVLRKIKEMQLGARARALPKDVFQLIVEDPEWKFGTWSDEGLDRGAENHYPTSALAEIKARKVSELAADDCVYFLWATVPMMPQALELMRYRGFEYKSQWAWDKVELGTGYWNRNQHEILLVGVKGKVPAPAMGTQYASILVERKGVHSAKPEISYQMIEDYYPSLKKIELNARRARPGWARWGNEAPEEDETASATASAAMPPAGATSIGGNPTSTQSGEVMVASPQDAVTEAADVTSADPQWSAPATREGAGAVASGGEGGVPYALPAQSLVDADVEAQELIELAPRRMNRDEAEPVLRAHYATSSGDEIGAMLGGVPVNTVRNWANFYGLTSRQRIGETNIARAAAVRARVSA